MLIEKSVEASRNLFAFPQIKPESNTDNTLISEEISRELEESSLRDNADSPDGVFEFLVEKSNQVQEEFDKLLGEDTDKKRFLELLSKILASILNTKVKTAEKMKKIIKNNPTRAKHCQYKQNRTDNKNNQCNKKIYTF